MTATTKKGKQKPARGSKSKPKPIPRSPAGKLNLAGWKDEVDRPRLQPDKVTTVSEFLKTGESTAYWGPYPCVREEGTYAGWVFVIWKNGSFFECGTFSRAFSSATEPHFEAIDNWTKRTIPEAVLIKSLQPKQRKFDLLVNGDLGDSLVHLKDKSAVVTASFDIFTELLAPKGERIPLSRVVGWLNTGTIQILDFRPDETKGLNPAAKRKISAAKEKNRNRRPTLSEARKLIRPPEAGFTLVWSNDFEWHRSATILFRWLGSCPRVPASDDVAGLRCRCFSWRVYIIGQDEDTYFGCQLADHPETVNEAYYSLMPERARKVIGLQRQGEWYAIPVPANKVPKMEECIATFDDDTGITLPREPKGSPHTIAARDGRITAAGVFAKDGYMYHGDHKKIEFPAKQWVTFVRNTAVRSVSREGVD